MGSTVAAPTQLLAGMASSGKFRESNLSYRHKNGTTSGNVEALPEYCLIFDSRGFQSVSHPNAWDNIPKLLDFSLQMCQMWLPLL